MQSLALDADVELGKRDDVEDKIAQLMPPPGQSCYCAWSCVESPLVSFPWHLRKWDWSCRKYLEQPCWMIWVSCWGRCWRVDDQKSFLQVRWGDCEGCWPPWDKWLRRLLLSVWCCGSCWWSREFVIARQRCTCVVRCPKSQRDRPFLQQWQSNYLVLKVSSRISLSTFWIWIYLQ